MRRALVTILCVALSAPGCATTTLRLNAPGHANGQSAGAQQTVDPAVIAAFAKQLAPGSRVRIRAAGRPTIRGTFMGTTDGQIVVQPRTRIMEPAVEVPIDPATTSTTTSSTTTTTTEPDEQPGNGQDDTTTTTTSTTSTTTTTTEPRGGGNGGG